MPSNCSSCKGKQHEAKDMYPTCHKNIDAIRVWKMSFFFADGTEKIFDGEKAFWGTGEQARKLAENAVYDYESVGKEVVSFETERIEDA